MNSGDCIGHAKGNCRFPNDCKWEHLSSEKLQKLEKEVVARKGAAVSLVADGKKDLLKGKAQPQGKTAPTRATASNTFAALSGLLTDIINDVAVHDGVAALSGQEDVCGFGMGFHTRMVEEGSDQEEMVEGLSQPEHPDFLEISMPQTEISMPPMEHPELLDITVSTNVLWSIREGSGRGWRSFTILE